MLSTEKPLNAWELDSTVSPSSGARCAPAAPQSRPAAVAMVPLPPTNVGAAPGRAAAPPGGASAGDPAAASTQSRSALYPRTGRGARGSNVIHLSPNGG